MMQNPEARGTWHPGSGSKFNQNSYLKTSCWLLITDASILIITYIIWLVVWNIFYFSVYWRKSFPLTNIFQRGWNHQPVIDASIFFAGHQSLWSLPPRLWIPSGNPHQLEDIVGDASNPTKDWQFGTILVWLYCSLLLGVLNVLYIYTPLYIYTYIMHILYGSII